MRGWLPQRFYARDTERVARGLLGCTLESRIEGVRTAGRIVEVEAYLGADDPAAHSYRNHRSARNEVMFGPPGHAYVYFIYGMHWCVNAVTRPEGTPSAVLIRALEPTDGLDVMRRRRGTEDVRRLCSGPAKLCQALGITGDVNGERLDGKLLGIRRGQGRQGRQGWQVEATPRIGISRAADWPLRFVLAGSPYASRPGPSQRSRART